MDIIIAIICIAVCYFTGKIIEKNHYKKIKKREVALYKYPCISFGKHVLNDSTISNSFLVSGCVVLGCDHFKVFLANLRNLFGGNISVYESVLDRGRREAILRMREKAVVLGAKEIVNVKIETIMVDPIDAKTNPKVCMTAYGTAIKYGKRV